jgi:hypothetical protein
VEGFIQGPASWPRTHPAGSTTEDTLVANSDEKLRAVLATLEECKAALVLSGDKDTAQLVSVAILELRIKLNRIEDAELKALCDAMLLGMKAADQPKPQEGPRARSPVTLKLVK